MKFFNTAGPCNPDDHHMLPAAERLPEARELIANKGYFVLHAPRQTGKTTTLRALAKELTAEGQYAALYFTCETAHLEAPEVSDLILSAIKDAAQDQFPEELRPPDWPDTIARLRIHQGLKAWANRCPRPLVLFFDEIDTLQGDSLIDVLRQLRRGYTGRSDVSPFPQSVVLCGLRDVRDYKAASGGDPDRLGTASPFNIKIASVRLGDFTEAEVRMLYAQHTAESGQAFTDAALTLAFECTQGQPWLTNALADEIISKMKVSGTITEAHIQQAKERLVLARATHLDSLVARLHEPRVRKVLEPMIAGEIPDLDAAYNDDASYLVDLGLIRAKPLSIANPIYREVIVRILTSPAEDVIVDLEPRSFILPDGQLDMTRLLTEFAAWWREHAEIMTPRTPYLEAGAQLVLMGYLQRVVNGGGYVDREYGVGMGRIDLLVRRPYQLADGTRAEQREAIELKVWRDERPDPLPTGLKQLDKYLERLGLDYGILIVFDRRADHADKASQNAEITQTQTPSGRPVTLLRA